MAIPDGDIVVLLLLGICVVMAPIAYCGYKADEEQKQNLDNKLRYLEENDPEAFAGVQRWADSYWIANGADPKKIAEMRDRMGGYY